MSKKEKNYKIPLAGCTVEQCTYAKRILDYGCNGCRM